MSPRSTDGTLRGFSIVGDYATYTTGSPVSSYAPTGTVPQSVSVTSIAGVAVPPNPTGSFSVPDAVINNGGPVDIEIVAHGVPARPTLQPSVR